jgi:hypothetical protein
MRRIHQPGEDPLGGFLVVGGERNVVVTLDGRVHAEGFLEGEGHRGYGDAAQQATR